MWGVQFHGLIPSIIIKILVKAVRWVGYRGREGTRHVEMLTCVVLTRRVGETGKQTSQSAFGGRKLYAPPHTLTHAPSLILLAHPCGCVSTFFFFFFFVLSRGEPLICPANRAQKHNWVPRRKQDKAKTLDDIRKEAEAEARGGGPPG